MRECHTLDIRWPRNRSQSRGIELSRWTVHKAQLIDLCRNISRFGGVGTAQRERRELLGSHVFWPGRASRCWAWRRPGGDVESRYFSSNDAKLSGRSVGGEMRRSETWLWLLENTTTVKLRSRVFGKSRLCRGQILRAWKSPQNEIGLALQQATLGAEPGYWKSLNLIGNAEREVCMRAMGQFG